MLKLRLFINIIAVIAMALMALAGYSSKIGAATTMATTEHGEVCEGLQLSASISKPVVDSGDPVYLNVLITNVSNHPSDFVETSPEVEFKIDVSSDGNPKLVPWTLWGAEAQDPNIDRQFHHNVLVPLEPGESAQYYIEVSRLFDLTLPAKYKLSVRFSVAKESAKGIQRYAQVSEAKSNIIFFQIAEIHEPKRIILGADHAEKH